MKAEGQGPARTGGDALGEVREVDIGRRETQVERRRCRRLAVARPEEGLLDGTRGEARRLRTTLRERATRSPPSRIAGAASISARLSRFLGRQHQPTPLGDPPEHDAPGVHGPVRSSRIATTPCDA